MNSMEMENTGTWETNLGISKMNRNQIFICLTV